MGQRQPMPAPWVVGDRPWIWGDRTYIMGVLNVTPDSFSDGGDFDSLDRAIAHAQNLVAAGADVLDIGGQSTRPGAEEVPLESELDRVVPVIQALRGGDHGLKLTQIPISIDTTKAAVAQAALTAGANWVNDISGATFDPEMLPLVAQLGVPIILMHLRGNPETMQQLTVYQDLLGEIQGFLEQRLAAAIASGVAPNRIILDPGIGFAKTHRQNLTILQQLPRLWSLGCPILVGPSRKAFIGTLLNQPDPKARSWGTAAACCGAIAGGADMVRVHDVGPMGDVCRVADAVWRRSPFLDPRST